MKVIIYHGEKPVLLDECSEFAVWEIPGYKLHDEAYSCLDVNQRFEGDTTHVPSEVGQVAKAATEAFKKRLADSGFKIVGITLGTHPTPEAVCEQINALLDGIEDGSIFTEET